MVPLVMASVAVSMLQNFSHKCPTRFMPFHPFGSRTPAPGSADAFEAHFISPTKPIQSDGISIPSGTLGEQRTVETIAGDLTGYRVMARPVVPIRVRGGIVRVDVARAIVGTIVQVAPTAHSTHGVGINEVGVRSQRPPQKCTAIPNLEGL